MELKVYLHSPQNIAFELITAMGPIHWFLSHVFLENLWQHVTNKLHIFYLTLISQPSLQRRVDEIMQLH
jgi:hypothetical protein